VPWTPLMARATGAAGTADGDAATPGADRLLAGGRAGRPRPSGTVGCPVPGGVPEFLTVADPLEILDPTQAWFCVEEWQERSAGLHPEIAGPLELDLSADYLHKANISGGGPYSVWLPCTGPDPLVREEEHQLSFTDYLRRAFTSNGFPRADRQDEWLHHRFSRDQLADATDWLAGIEWERVDF
jgi:hypothetical protein